MVILRQMPSAFEAIQWFKPGKPVLILEDRKRRWQVRLLLRIQATTRCCGQGLRQEWEGVRVHRNVS